jgi:hypothetical protein
MLLTYRRDAVWQNPERSVTEVTIRMGDGAVISCKIVTSETANISCERELACAGILVGNSIREYVRTGPFDFAQGRLSGLESFFRLSQR